jgi:predicted transcriptional regulator of viral defense system
MELYKIRESALKSRRAVYTAQQLASLIGKPRAVAAVYLSRMVTKGLARRILRGYISLVDDDYVIASQFMEPSYISATSALNFHGLMQQVPARIECISTRNSRNYKNLGIRYHRMPPALFFGYERHAKGDSYMLMADAEKALIDAVYLNLISVDGARELLDKVDRKKINAYLDRFSGRGKKKLARCFI